MKRTEIALQVTDSLSEVLLKDESEFTPRFALTRENRVEPLDIAKFAIALEARFGLTLPDERVAEWRALSDAIALITELLEDGFAEPAQRGEEERVAWFYE